MIDFANPTDDEQLFVGTIVAKYADLLDKNSIPYEKFGLEMDILRTHKLLNLRLKEMANCDDGNFGHDVLGIYRHLNRQTGEMEDCFVPRFSS